jgi:hypothetical protein
VAFVDLKFTIRVERLRLVAYRQFVKKDSIRPHIDRWSNNSSIFYFWCLIARRAYFLLHYRSIIATLYRVTKTEITKFNLHLVPDQNIFKLQVLVNYEAGLVQVV